ncbi:MAG: hybrid sensor histidine kinase/response regulator [Pseudoxanthomonas suwonensis]|nr:MAG: hybrid sensor histidine kinase/response regulator [Pseudoxanthomonas suwonensis]
MSKHREPGIAAGGSLSRLEQLLDAMHAVRRGEFDVTLPAHWDGIEGLLANAFNDIVAADRQIARELDRVGDTVGRQGRLRERINVINRQGAWLLMEQSVNRLLDDLVRPIDMMTDVVSAVAKGDLGRSAPLEHGGQPLQGEVLRSAMIVNRMIEQMEEFSSEVTRVALEVGTAGRLGGQAEVKDVSGVWRELTDSVNRMASNLTAQVRNIAEVTIAVANGDLSRKITVDVRGEILQLKEAINTMVDQLRGFAAEVTRVAREVGTEGKLGGQAIVPGVAGTWKDLTDSVNAMASNLTSQVRNIAEVTTAVAEGNLSRKITVDVQGEMLALKNTINTMVDQLRGFAAEVTRVAREVGTEGKLGGQAQVPDVAGTWKDLTDNVNSMASNLTAQVRNIAEVTTAVARGDLSRKITVDVKGEILELKDTINTMVDQLRGFAAEVTRVAREVGTEGKLGGQAQVPGVAGTWADLTDSVNAMASNLTAQVRNIAEVTTAVARGDLSRKITVDVRGEILELKNTINTMVDQLNGFAAEVTRVAREVGSEGNLGGQAQVPGVAGTWKDLTDNVNSMASNLTSQVRNIAEVTTAVARGDLSRKITVDVQGEILELKDTINTMVDQLNGFAAEVTRVAREVGTEGKLGGQAQVPGVAGTWKDLTDNVNSMATNLTAQVRGIAKVVTEVANGNLQQKLTVEAKGEIAELADTINSMTDTLGIFAEQVTTVAREVGVEGRLGGQANVPGTAGIWKDLTANVNQLAENLTTQVRAIADVATAVTQGDLTRSIQVDVRGELADLKDNMNAMIGTLRATTESNREQDWLKTHLANFSRMMQGQRDLQTLGNQLLSELAPLVDAQQGLLYVVEPGAGARGGVLRRLAGYAVGSGHEHDTVRFGEGLVGQCAAEQRAIVLDGVPDGSIRIQSGLVSAQPHSILVLPVLFEGQVKAVIELASLTAFTPGQLSFLDQLSGSIGIVLNTIEASMRTEHLLAQSQQLASELQSQQKELQQTNADIATKAQLLAEQKNEVEAKNQQIEQARVALEDKAAELALTSRYKSEFLANMSHELRTPLNSILILGQQLAENPDENLTGRQVEFAKTIHAAGTDLLNLISDILDLSKIESGTVTVDSEELRFAALRENMLRGFRHEAERRHLQFSVEMDPALGRSMTTDPKRLQQILKNLLSNAFKFTERGSVQLHARKVESGWSAGHPILDHAPAVVAFEVRDTGIGISPDKQKIVFEAFQQADAGTSRKYGGTGLGLAISREIAGLLGGELRLDSTVGGGSTFTLYLPVHYVGADAAHAPLPREAEPSPDHRHDDRPLPPLEEVDDDRDSVQPGEPCLLVIEDDAAYATILRDLGRSRGFKVIVVNRGSEGLRLAREFKPAAITLDVFLPDMLGWTVLSRLKQEQDTRHIPVQIVTVEDERHQSIEKGAFSYLAKPSDAETIDAALERIRQYSLPRVKRLLVVEDDPAERSSIDELIRHDDVAIEMAGSGEEALQALDTGKFDCVVLDLKLPDMTGFDLLERIAERPDLRDLPVVVHTGRDLSKDEDARLRKAAKSVVIKGVESPERLLDETALFLHRVIDDLPPAKQAMVRRLHDSNEILAGRRVLVVDDDVRNIFALSTVLERQGMHAITASNGQEAIEKVAEGGIDLVLMDIMMPGMDGYDTMRAIRMDPDSRALPIIALTAKAMKGDREKCMEAGASDYLAKPVVTDQLLAMMRNWMQR